MKVLPYLIW